MPFIVFLCFAFSAFASKASGAEAQLSADNFDGQQYEINTGNHSQISLNLKNFDSTLTELLSDHSLADIVKTIAIAIEDNEPSAAGLPPMNNEMKRSWEQIFSASNDYYLIEKNKVDYISFTKIARADLSLFADIDSISKIAGAGYATHNIFGTDYLIWPFSEGRHELGRVLNWPLHAVIGFHNHVEEYNGTMQLSTNDYLANAQFTNGVSEIQLSFAASEFITEPIFITNARLDMGEKIYDADLLIAQIFPDDQSIAPLFGQFVTIAPDARAPHYGVFESQ